VVLRSGVDQGDWKLQLNFNSISTPLQLNKTRADIWRSVASPTKPYRNCKVAGGKVGKLTGRQLDLSVSCELSSRPVVKLTMENKYLEERNILFF
jgi:hypothetical protein